MFLQIIPILLTLLQNVWKNFGSGS